MMDKSKNYISKKLIYSDELLILSGFVLSGNVFYKGFR